MTVFIGVDPASATGAVGVLSSEGNYLDCYMIEHQDKHIRAMVLKNALLKSIADKRLPGSTASALPIPPAGAIADIKADPSLIPAFDQKYGKGAAAKYLKAK